MLRSFRVGNHRSFRDEQELLLMPVYAKDRVALPVAAIYGANASGKSNLLDALKFMADAVGDSFSKWKPEGGVPRRPFRLDPTAGGRPSVFVAEFVAEGVRYTYGFEVDDRRVLAEWLYSYPEKRKRVLFDRTGDEIKFGAAIGEGPKAEVLGGLLRPNALFLSLAARSNLAAVAPPYRWFVHGLHFRGDERSVDLGAQIAGFLGEDVALRAQTVDLLRAADFGIVDIELGRDVPAVTERDVMALIDSFDISAERKQEMLGDGVLLELFMNAAGVGASRRARRRTRLVHGDGQAFELDEESAGTRSWLRMLPDVLRILRDGGVLVIDEIDTSLHPLLTARLVALFNDSGTNLADGQLIFTTHEATLLHPPLAAEVLDRDEVWFVEKDRAGASTLYPLSDFKPRREDNLERRYLAGQYGAVPNVYEESFSDAVRGDAADVEA